MRPGLRGERARALESFDSTQYVNELGVLADRIEHLAGDLSALGLQMVAWYGVRAFNDAILADAPIPSDDDLALLLEAEDLAGRCDPYRWMGSQLHVIAARQATAKPS